MKTNDVFKIYVGHRNFGRKEVQALCLGPSRTGKNWVIAYENPHSEKVEVVTYNSSDTQVIHSSRKMVLSSTQMEHTSGLLKKAGLIK